MTSWIDLVFDDGGNELSIVFRDPGLVDLHLREQSITLSEQDAKGIAEGILRRLTGETAGAGAQWYADERVIVQDIVNPIESLLSYHSARMLIERYDCDDWRRGWEICWKLLTRGDRKWIYDDEHRLFNCADRRELARQMLAWLAEHAEAETELSEAAALLRSLARG